MTTAGRPVRADAAAARGGVGPAVIGTAAGLLLSLLAAPALAAPAASVTPAAVACTSVEPADERLACYDRALGRVARPETGPADSGPVATVPAPAAAVQTAPPPLATAVPGSLLSSIWELRPADKRGLFRLQPHKANYLLPVHVTTRANRLPSSPAPGHALSSPLPVDATEAKFQLSFKAKALENLFGDNGDVWLAYTQQSNWQLYNRAVSSPFREVNHEPEAILSLRTDGELLGWRWRLLNLGFVHQSNGRPLPLSRSWNRVYAQFGFERGNFTLLARPWIRLPEKRERDDNPDIGDYLGSGDLRLAYVDGRQVYSLLGRWSTRGRRGGLQAEWAFPISGALKGYVQLTSGYGASLIDYNHAQTTVGAGLLLLDWQ